MQDLRSPPPAVTVPVAADTVTTEQAFGQASNAGAAATFSRGDHTHGTPGMPAIPAPSDSVVPEVGWGQASTAGIGISFSRGDHTHGTPAAPVIPVAAATVTTETAYGQASNAGAAATFSRGDHTHGTPAAQVIPVAADTVVTETAFGQASNAGANATFSRSDHTHGTPASPVIPVAADTVVTETAFGQASTAGTNATFSRSDHTHGTMTDPIPAHVGAPDPHTQYQLESEKGNASGYASLNASTKVVEDPANATATPTPSKIPISDGSGWLNSWISEEPWCPGVSIDGSGAVIVAGSKGYRLIGDACTIKQWMILADAAGNITIDVKKGAFGTFPTTNSICGGAPPSLTAASSGQSSALGAWTATLAQGDILEFVVSGPTVMTKAWLFLRISRH